MGKTGGRVNYVSDVDVIFVAEPAGDADETTARGCHGLATHLMRACSTSTAQGTLWPVDAATAGARPPRADRGEPPRLYWALGQDVGVPGAAQGPARRRGPRTRGGVPRGGRPLVWQAASGRTSSRTCRRCGGVEQHVPPAEADRQLKLGPGGLRDVEFSVQLLQLVHGRADDTLRGTTLEALDALAQGGYVGREDAAALDDSYRLLRTLEHRIQALPAAPHPPHAHRRHRPAPPRPWPRAPT